MNRYLLHIAWFESKMIYRTLTSIQKALEYSTVPTEIIIFLNEQTLIDDPPLKGTPTDMWKEFINHPLISRCKIITLTNEDPFTGVSKIRREYRSDSGLTYWGESDCLPPLEYFYVAENFQKIHENKPYVITFATRKMWDGWELIEHPIVNGIKMIGPSDITNDNDDFRLHFSGPMTPEWLYEFNEKQGNPEIILLPKSRIEGSLTILSEGMPEPLLCPTQDFVGEDFCLELAMTYYNIPQYHVKNILKGHDTNCPIKRTNVSVEKIKLAFSNAGKIRKEKEVKEMFEFIKSLYQNNNIK